MSPLGLGDSIIVNGLVRCLCKEFDKVYFPCWTHNLPSVKFMFSDEPKIQVQEVTTPNDIFIMQVQHETNGVKVLKLGTYHGTPPLGRESFDETFYRQAGVDFSERWNSFKSPFLGSHLELSDPKKPIAFIADSKERGFEIEDQRIDISLMKFRPWNSFTVFEFAPILEAADEVHAIDSAFMHLIESIPVKGKLFYHQYARQPVLPYNQVKKRKHWTTLV